MKEINKYTKGTEEKYICAQRKVEEGLWTDVRGTHTHAAITLGSPLHGITGSRPIPAFGRGSRHTETGKERKHEAPHTRSHPPAISHPYDGPSSTLTSCPAAAPLDRSYWLSERSIRQDALWDKYADTRSSAVATRRHPRCKCAAFNRACHVDCLSVVFLPTIEPNTASSATDYLPSPTEESRSCNRQSVGE